ncbi:MAG: TetR/AcrR family transcriptional regulator [Lachnospiraceae bacterium]|nr:TetR/AcrR family transcriptional regulator [Lachnospiraceae bacterium]
MNTKQRIIREALALFAERGYRDVFVTDIANAVGIKAPSLYKHFSSKKDIFDAILAQLRVSYEHQALSIGIDGNGASDATVYHGINADALVEKGTSLFQFFLHDEQMRLFRRLLTLEQFRDPELAQLYSRQYYDDIMAYQTSLFQMLMKGGECKMMDARIAAVQFFSPIYLLLTVCDRQPEREAEAMETLAAHFRQFHQHYQA